MIITYCNKEKQKINVYAIGSTIKGGNGGYIVGAQYLLIQSINNDSTILNKYDLNFIIINAENSKSSALSKSLHLLSKQTLINNTDSSISIPIVFGCPTSSLSIITNPALSAFNWAQISSASTSIQLSDKSTFPSFYRTIPSDDIQSKCIILMCQKFNWSTIGILYYADSYGMYLTNNILKLANKLNIKSYSISYVADDKSIKNAVKTIQEIGVYIIVLIPQNWAINATFSILKEYGLMQFPYYYIGVDSWFDSQRIKTSQIASYSKGFLGTIPWQGPTALSYQQYANHGLGEVYNTSIKTYNDLLTKWHNAYQFNDEFREILGNTLHSITYHSVYSWDSARTLIHALDIYDKLYNLSDLNDIDIKNFSIKLQNIIKSNSFLSATGNVSFDENGDRKHGVYTFGNVIDNNGTVRHIAIFHDDHVDGNLNASDIIWPNEFTKRKIIPMSEKFIIYETIEINKTLHIIFIILSCLSMLIVFGSLITTFKWRHNRIVKATSWKLNIITCIGCLLAYIAVILYGMPLTTYICNVREWLFVISFTLVFMPLFMKSYRLSIIFTSGLNIKPISDRQLVIGVIICLLIDLIVLSIFTGIEPKFVMYFNDSIQNMHALCDKQLQRAICTKSFEKARLTYYLIIAFYKFIELIFGIYVALIVSSIGLKQMQRFNETKSQIFAIIVTIFILIIGAIPLLFRGYNDDTYYYLILGIVTLLIPNIVLGANILPRLMAIYHKTEYKFNLTQQEEFRREWKKWTKKKGMQYLKNIYYTSDSRHLYTLKMMKNDMGLNSMQSIPEDIELIHA